MGIQERYLLSEYVRPDFPLHLQETDTPWVPMHSHDFYEIAFVAEGTVAHELESGESVVLEAGDFVLLNPFERHAYRAGRRPMRMVNLIFGSEFPAMLGHGLGQEELLLPFYFQRRVGRTGKVEGGTFPDLMAGTLKSYDRKAEGWRLDVTGNVIRILASVRRVLGREGTRRNPWEISKITPILAHIDARFREPMTLGDVSRLVGLSATYVSELFHRTTGKTFIRYLQERRLRYAIHVLEQTDLPVRQVCLAAGFSDLTHFARQVRRQSGFAPMALRKRRGALALPPSGTL